MNKISMLFQHIPAGVKNGLLIIFGEGIPRVLMLVGTLAAARIIGAETYGTYGILWAKSQLSWSLIEFGTGMAGARDLAKILHDEEKPDVIPAILGLRILLWVAVMCGWIIFVSHDLWTGLFVSVYLLAQSLTPDWILRASERFWLIGKNQFASALLFLVFIVIFASKFHSVESLLAANAIQAGIYCVTLWLAVPHGLKKSAIELPSARLMLLYARRGAFFAVTGGFLQAGMAGFLTATGNIYGIAMAGVATAMLRIYQLINTVSFMLAYGFYPRLSRGDSVSERGILQRMMFVSGVAWCLIFPLLAIPLAGILLGNAYSGMEGISLAASAGLIFGAIRFGYSIPLSASRRHWETLTANSMYCLVGCLAPYLLEKVFSHYSLSPNWVGLTISLAEGVSLTFVLFALAIQSRNNGNHRLKG